MAIRIFLPTWDEASDPDSPVKDPPASDDVSAEPIRSSPVSLRFSARAIEVVDIFLLASTSATSLSYVRNGFRFGLM